MSTTTCTATAPTTATTAYRVVDSRTGDTIGRPYTTRTRARRAADRLDLQYGAVRYFVRETAAAVACVQVSN